MKWEMYIAILASIGFSYLGAMDDQQQQDTPGLTRRVSFRKNSNRKKISRGQSTSHMPHNRLDPNKKAQSTSDLGKTNEIDLQKLVKDVQSLDIKQLFASTEPVTRSDCEQIVQAKLVPVMIEMQKLVLLITTLTKHVEILPSAIESAKTEQAQRLELLRQDVEELNTKKSKNHKKK